MMINELDIEVYIASAQLRQAIDAVQQYQSTPRGRFLCFLANHVAKDRLSTMALILIVISYLI